VRGSAVEHSEGMKPLSANSVVHLELRTGNLGRACAFYTRLFGWNAERVELAGGSYLTLELGDCIAGGAVESESGSSIWLPYVEVADVVEATERARRLGGAVLLDAREGPVGWRSVVAAPAGAEIALWQPKC
jgi:uncharacterized protein